MISREDFKKAALLSEEVEILEDEIKWLNTMKKDGAAHFDMNNTIMNIYPSIVVKVMAVSGVGSPNPILKEVRIPKECVDYGKILDSIVEYKGKELEAVKEKLKIYIQ